MSMTLIHSKLKAHQVNRVFIYSIVQATMMYFMGEIILLPPLQLLVLDLLRLISSMEPLQPWLKSPPLRLDRPFPLVKNHLHRPLLQLRTIYPLHRVLLNKSLIHPVVSQLMLSI